MTTADFFKNFDNHYMDHDLVGGLYKTDEYKFKCNKCMSNIYYLYNGCPDKNYFINTGTGYKNLDLTCKDFIIKNIIE